ncbi:hypothetical protein FPOAC2_13535 [Fusarium poae]|jgi:hypothetical protein|uniref:uncharacterized protein n=1 Tax=Fusarium poae TaxID=36050 RepID=UPI001D053A74|nr:uncharacterized protein FPOAC1_013956 [Fusarium poae]KAG8664249.1 hypothetical protein FPOAC1_013956 [Fusarium poae]
MMSAGLDNDYHDVLSSPARRGLKHIRNIVNEAVLLEDVITRYVDDRRARIEKRYHQRKRGKRAKPMDDYFLTTSLQDLRNQQGEYLAAEESKDQKSQLRATRSLAKREMERIKEEWRENKEAIVDGFPKNLRFKQWLQHTGKDVEYASYDEQRARISTMLSEKADFPQCSVCRKASQRGRSQRSLFR